MEDKKVVKLELFTGKMIVIDFIGTTTVTYAIEFDNFSGTVKLPRLCAYRLIEINKAQPEEDNTLTD